MAREHLLDADVSCGHEPDGHGVCSPGFSRLRTAQPAKAGTTNQLRFIESFDLQFWSRIGAMNLINRGRDQRLNPAPLSEPDGRISRIRLSSQWVRNHTMAHSQPCAAAKDSGPRAADPEVCRLTRGELRPPALSPDPTCRPFRLQPSAHRPEIARLPADRCTRRQASSFARRFAQ